MVLILSIRNEMLFPRMYVATWVRSELETVLVLKSVTCGTIIFFVVFKFNRELVSTIIRYMRVGK